MTDSREILAYPTAARVLRSPIFDTEGEHASVLAGIRQGLFDNPKFSAVLFGMSKLAVAQHGYDITKEIVNAFIDDANRINPNPKGSIIEVKPFRNQVELYPNDSLLDELVRERYAAATSLGVYSEKHFRFRRLAIAGFGGANGERDAYQAAQLIETFLSLDPSYLDLDFGVVTDGVGLAEASQTS